MIKYICDFCSRTFYIGYGMLNKLKILNSSQLNPSSTLLNEVKF